MGHVCQKHVWNMCVQIHLPKCCLAQYLRGCLDLAFTATAFGAATVAVTATTARLLLVLNPIWRRMQHIFDVKRRPGLNGWVGAL